MAALSVTNSKDTTTSNKMAPLVLQGNTTGWLCESQEVEADLAECLLVKRLISENQQATSNVANLPGHQPQAQHQLTKGKNPQGNLDNYKADVDVVNVHKKDKLGS